VSRGSALQVIGADADIARAEASSASAARRAAEAARIARANAAHYQRLKQVQKSIDDEIDDEAAGAAPRLIT
jgi:serine phosphatase RsbU (regulator of sigma subunit)